MSSKGVTGSEREKHFTDALEEGLESQTLKTLQIVKETQVATISTAITDG